MKEKRKKRKKYKNSLTFLADDNLHIQLKIITDKLQVNYSEYIRNAVQKQLEQDKKEG